MAQMTDNLRVVRAPGELSPRSFHWGGRLVRVEYVARVRTRGTERKYRVQTAEGAYELGWDRASDRWRMCHSPSLFSRAWAEMRRLPRYPLPDRQRRALCAQPVPVAVRASRETEGGSHAQGIALVRQ